MPTTVAPGDLLEKDTNEKLIYQFDWTDWLVSAQIASSTFNIEGQDVGQSGSLSGDQSAIVTGNLKTQIRLSDGMLYQTYTIENKIVTNESPAQTAERSFKLEIVDR